MKTLFDPEIAALKKVYGWLRDNWEPVTALSALFIASFGAYSTYSAQKMTNENELLTRMPLVLIWSDPDSFKIQNIGPGPGVVYQAYLRHGDDEVILFSNDEMRESQKKFAHFRANLTKEYTNDSLTFSMPIGPFRSEYDAPFIKTTAGEAEFSRLIEQMSITLCSSDWTGKITGVSHVNSDFKCGPAPVYVER